MPDDDRRSGRPATVLWFRRDLRLSDHPALLAALETGHDVLPVFVRDPRLVAHGGARVRRLEASLAALARDTGGALVVRTGDPARVVPELAREVGAGEVHISRETTPYGRSRDQRVKKALGADGARLVETGSPYAVGPGRLLTATGHTPFRVFTPFSRAWHDHGRSGPGPRPDAVPWRRGIAGDPVGAPEPGAGEAAALARWAAFVGHHLDDYAKQRNRPDLDTTSRMSAHLKYGEIHPRTMLADLDEHADRSGAERYTTELCWREFYADVLYHCPHSAWQDLTPALRGMEYDEGPEVDELVEAWRRGRTGFPLVDAGMRQLLAESWMHNRVRMVTASFLVKDLHVWWPVGARHFLDHLVDGDLASNNHGWQWVAGTGTDPSPYFRVFNPVSQGLRFDPDGAYVRHWVPELAHLEGAAAHEPWRHPDGLAHGYPERIVDHAAERRRALYRYERARA
ncbi:deoxyribodipyrimidine photo-lyase [Pseudonocardia zijingensis]|uniref:Deoxyribodipyrimidine photo-lyase n=1 Tax=Pseudonocardia zijingensis TaxID=153376 RepID=A0ABN1P4A1_9PSEU